MQTDDERRARWTATGMCHTPGYPAPSAPKYGDPTGAQVAEFVEQHLDITLDPWQRQVLDKVYAATPRPVPTYADRITDAKTTPRARWWRRLTWRKP